MKSALTTTLVFIFWVNTNVFGQYITEYDKDFEFECPKGTHLNHIGSEHSNSKEDRRWKFDCAEGMVKDEECDWTQDYVNSYDQVMNWKCPDNGIVVGAKSTHSNSKEDRIWKFKCCKVSMGGTFNPFLISEMCTF